MPGMDGMELQEHIHRIDPQAAVIMITAFASVDTAVRALKQGAFDYVTKPIDPDELSHLVLRALEQRRLREENVQLRETHRRAGRRSTDRRRQPAHAEGHGAGRARGQDRRHGADPRRERHRQGAHRPGHPRQQQAALLSHRGRSTAAPCRRACWKASCSATRRGPSPAPSTAARERSRWPTAARCSSTRWGPSTPRCRSTCCGCWRPRS